MRGEKSASPTSALRGFKAAGLIAGLAVMANVALAGTISDVVMTVQVESSLGSGEFKVKYDPDLYNPETGAYAWSLLSPVEITNEGGDVIATVGGLNTVLNVDPVVNIGFLVTAGAADTSVTVTSALIGFGPLNNPTARASAQVGATDLNGNGVSIAGDFGGKSYTAQYNGLAPAGSVFANLVNDQAYGAFDSNALGEDSPLGGGFNVIPGAVSSMSASFSLTVSAHDQASGTSVYVIVPEPASLALLFGGVLMAIRRR